MQQNNISAKNITRTECCRTFASMWIVDANLENSSPLTFSKRVFRVFETFQKSFQCFQCFHILKGYTAFQSSKNYFKYSEKPIGFSHGNLYNLHLLSNSSPAKTWLSTRNRISLTCTTLMVDVLSNRKSLDFDYLKSKQMRCLPKISQMSLTSTGNPN